MRLFVTIYPILYGRNLYEGERESNGKYTFAAHMDGVYRYCFSNKMSTMTPKIVMFTMEILEKEAEKAAGEEGDAVDSHNKLEDMIKELGTALTCKICSRFTHTNLNLSLG